MGAPQFTNNGLSIQSYADVFNDYVDALKLVYGDIDLDSNTPDGQRAGITAKAIFDLQVFVLAFYNGLDKYLATGEQLKIIGKISGIQPAPAQQSAWNLEITSSVAFNLPSGFTIKDNTGHLWSTNTDVTLAASTQTVRFLSGDFAAVPGAIGATFTQQTVEPSITNIVAEEAATPGVPAVTDEDYRSILRRSVENPSLSTIGKMASVLLATAGVTGLNIHENKTDTTDASGTPANSLWCIVEGGSDADVGKSILLNKTAGTGLRGDVVLTIPEVINPTSTISVTLNHLVKFQRPSLIPLHIRADITARTGFTVIDVELVRRTIAEIKYQLGKSVEATQIYADAYQAGNNFVLTNMEISRDGTTYTDGELVAAIQERFTLELANVVLTEL